MKVLHAQLYSVPTSHATDISFPLGETIVLDLLNALISPAGNDEDAVKCGVFKNIFIDHDRDQLFVIISDNTFLFFQAVFCAASCSQAKRAACAHINNLTLSASVLIHSSFSHYWKQRITLVAYAELYTLISLHSQFFLWNISC